MYIILKLLSAVAKIIPRKAGYYLFKTAALFLLLLPGKKKHVLKKNLLNVLGRENAGRSLVKSVYKNYAMYYFDLLKGNTGLLKYNKKEGRTEIEKKMDDAIEKYGGCVLCSLHLGNWDYGGAHISRSLKHKVSVVVEKLSPGIYEWFRETREKLGLEVIESRDIKSMLTALKNKKMLILLFDRDLDKKGLVSDFFGKKAYIPRGPAALALRAKVPLVFGIIPRSEKNPEVLTPDYDSSFLNLDTMERTVENETKITRELIKKAEYYISGNPQQWCMLQEVWAAPEARGNGTVEK